MSEKGPIGELLVYTDHAMLDIYIYYIYIDSRIEQK